MNDNTLRTMFSSSTDLWATPQDFFDRLNEEFHFTLDPCTNGTNTKCPKLDDIRYFETGIQEALDIIRDWQNNGNDKANVIEVVEKKLLELHVRKYR